jgi:hypothetical protein
MVRHPQLHQRTRPFMILIPPLMPRNTRHRPKPQHRGLSLSRVADKPMLELLVLPRERAARMMHVALRDLHGLGALGVREAGARVAMVTVVLVNRLQKVEALEGAAFDFVPGVQDAGGGVEGNGGGGVEG